MVSDEVSLVMQVIPSDIFSEMPAVTLTTDSKLVRRKKCISIFIKIIKIRSSFRYLHRQVKSSPDSSLQISLMVRKAPLEENWGEG